MRQLFPRRCLTANPNAAYRERPVGLPGGTTKRNKCCEDVLAGKLLLLPHEVAGGGGVRVTLS
jgi:hypothetical protein